MNMSEHHGQFLCTFRKFGRPKCIDREEFSASWFWERLLQNPGNQDLIFRVANCNPHTTYTPLAVALARMRRRNSEHCPEGWCRRRRPVDSIFYFACSGWWVPFLGDASFLAFFEQCCAVLSVSPNWSHGSPKKILGSRPSATFMSWNKYVSHQMRCSEVSVSKVLLTSCRFWASFRAWPGIQLRHEMLTHAYSNSPLTVRKNVFIRSWMNFMNCEWQSHLPQFKLDRSVWLSCTSIERQKHTQDSCADLPGSVWFSRFRRATARKYDNLMQFVAWEKNHKQHLRLVNPHQFSWFLRWAQGTRCCRDGQGVSMAPDRLGC